jgi:NADH-quinone oxidoreductase subunit F
MRELIEEYAGGIRGGRKIKIIVPGGASATRLTGEHIDVGLDFESMAAAGSMIGTGGVIVLDETVSAVEVAYKMDEFFKHESCGKCTPCREGTYWLVKNMHSLLAGHGKAQDIPTLHDIYNQMAGNCFCLLGESAVMPIKSALRLFPEEFEALVTSNGSKHAIPLVTATH